METWIIRLTPQCLHLVNVYSFLYVLTCHSRPLAPVIFTARCCANQSAVLLWQVVRPSVWNLDVSWSVVTCCNYSTQRAQTSAPNASSSRIRIVIRNGLPDPDSDADRHENVISWSLDHTPALHKISSKSVGNSIIRWIRISDSDSWIRSVIRIVTKIELIGFWAMP